MSRRRALRAAALLALLPVFGACVPAFGGGSAPQPRRIYERSLERADLEATALGRDWLEAGTRALTDAAIIRMPFRESMYIAPTQPAALAYRLQLREAQHLIVRTESQSAVQGDVFVDIFEARSNSQFRLVHSVRGAGPQIDLTVPRDGEYVVRLQPELLRGGRFTIAVEARAALVWPVFGRDERAVLSVYGDDRDSGVRSHEGIDIGAVRGTPAIATANGVVERVQNTPVGGKVVWLRDPAHAVSLYYAHLDAQLVQEGQAVRQGDTLGLVGNTGNARGAAPHLHFGVYVSRDRTMDPKRYLRAAAVLAPVLLPDTLLVGSFARISRAAVRLRQGPQETAPIVEQMERSTAVTVVGGLAGWYRVRVPDGRTGFISAALLEAADPPLRNSAAPAAIAVHDAPRSNAALIETLPAGTALPVLALYREYLWVQTPNGRFGWIIGEL